MEWIVNNWGFLLIILAAIIGTVDLVRNDKEKAKKWLLLACIQAEKELGAKTGALKLRYVYDMFLQAFPLLSKFMTFETFSDMVDETLEEMKRLVNTNMAVYNIVNGSEKSS